MKKLLTIFLISASCFSQDKIGFGIFQDAKLLIGADAEHGNDKPTLDILVYVDLQGKQLNGYYFSVQPFYNEARLFSGYLKRYGVNTVWNFNGYNNFTTSLGVGFGFIHRHGIGEASYQALGELSYKISQKIKVSLRYEFIRRSDIDKFRHNGLIGLKYN